jgi:hypothetical protein
LCRKQETMPTMKQPGEKPQGTTSATGRGDAGDVHTMRRAARQELEQARRLRADAEKYHRETAIRARSEAQQLMLKARLAVDKEIAALTKKATEEIQKVLADIRVIRITAQEELAAQRKFTDAARLSSMSVDLDRLEKQAPARARKAHVTTSSNS